MSQSRRILSHLRSMSKPISFGFGKSKPSTAPKATVSQPTAKRKPANGLHDSDNEDEEEPRHESVSGFSSSGVILSQSVQEKPELVIKNLGNGDWRRRGKVQNLLPAEVQAARNGQQVVTVEKDEVSKASGLQFAQQTTATKAVSNGAPAVKSPVGEHSRRKHMTDDEVAMEALLDNSGRAKSNVIIEQLGNTRLSARDETSDFRADVATRPESSTVEQYAAMPVEEFGLAMLRGMGQKRRANGETINVSGGEPEDSPRKQRKQEGFLGIGAKAAPGADVELGAWGKADMRKNNKGEGFFTPLMRENKNTGERITEEEFQNKLRQSKGSKSGKNEDDWRDRRDRNLERSGRDKEKSNGGQKFITNGTDEYADQMNSFSRHTSSSRRDKDDREYDSSRSRQGRSRSRDRRKRRDDDDHDSRHHDKHRERYREDDRHDSSSSRTSRHRDDKDRERSHRR